MFSGNVILTPKVINQCFDLMVKVILIMTNDISDTLHVSLGVSICLDRVSVETLDFDTDKELVSTVRIIWTLFKS